VHARMLARQQPSGTDETRLELIKMYEQQQRSVWNRELADSGYHETLADSGTHGTQRR